MWKLQDFLSLRFNVSKLSFGHFEALKTAILTIWAAVNFEIFETINIFMHEIVQKSKFKASKIVKMVSIYFLKSIKIDFM